MSDQKPIQYLEPGTSGFSFTAFHDVLLRQIAAKVGVPFEGLGHVVPAEKDHRIPQSRPIGMSPVMAMPYGGTPDPQPGGVCGDGPGDASATGDIGLPEIEVGQPSPDDVQDRAWSAWFATHADALTAAGYVHVLREIAAAGTPEVDQFVPEAPTLLRQVQEAMLRDIAAKGLDRVIEDAIVTKCIDTFLARNFEIAVFNDHVVGPDTEACAYTTDRVAIVSALRSTDCDCLTIRHLSGQGRMGWVAFTWGNGADVIHDYSASETEGSIPGVATMMTEVIEPFVDSIDERVQERRS